jgi:hypothetical protein
MIPKGILCHGTDEPLKKAIKLRAGSLSMIFEPASAFLRCIRMEEKELVRGIYVAVRDRNWDTVRSKVSNLKVEYTQDGFDISFEVECIEREIVFFWTGTVIGDPEGRVTFTMHGIARSTFLRNRIGFCVLHPMQEYAGKPCSVERYSLRGSSWHLSRNPFRRRHLRDGRPAQLDGCLIQDLLHAARAALPHRGKGGDEDSPVGDFGADRGGFG